MANDIAAQSVSAVQTSLRYLRAIRWGEREETIVADAQEAQRDFLTHPDALEGPRARLEGRTPRFTS